MSEEFKTSAMFNLVEQWQKSGKSQKQFSLEKNIKLYSLTYWTKKYHQSKNAYQGFATVTFTPETESVTSVPKIEIELSGGAIVRIF